MRLILIEDDVSLAQGLTKRLEEHQNTVDWFATIEEAAIALENSDYDVIILDWMLEDGDGVEFLKHSRKRGLETPVIMLTARDEIGDRVNGLDAGADDYIVKPFSVSELQARLRALSRRPSSIRDDALFCGNLSLNLSTKQVSVGSETLYTTATEYKALECFLRNPGRVWPKAQLGDYLYALHTEWSDNAVETIVHRLRKKLENADARVIIRTLRGLGYKMEERQG